MFLKWIYAYKWVLIISWVHCNAFPPPCFVSQHIRLCRNGLTVAQATLLLTFLVTHNYTHTNTPISTPLNEWSARHRCRYLHNTGDEHLSMPSAGFDPTISAIKRLQTYSLDHSATWIGSQTYARPYVCKVLYPCGLITDVVWKCKCPQFYPRTTEKHMWLASCCWSIRERRRAGILVNFRRR